MEQGDTERTRVVADGTVTSLVADRGSLRRIKTYGAAVANADAAVHARAPVIRPPCPSLLAPETPTLMLANLSPQTDHIRRFMGRFVSYGAVWRNFTSSQ
jgi:hypothetical protein